MKVVTFGEIMLRLAPKGYERFFQNYAFNASFGGGEANVAVSLSNYGIKSAFVTKLPKHEIGQAAVAELKKFGVCTKHILLDDHRMGIYYLEKGASQRPSKVIYDRAHSSIANAQLNEFDWESIFEGVDWFHFTGITPALGSNVAQVCLEALKNAKKHKITVSCDLNYRKNLWSTDTAKQVMVPLMEYVDVLIANEEDAAKVFGITSKGTEVESGVLNPNGYKDVARQLVSKFGFKKVFITLRESINANHNNWSAMAFSDDHAYFSKKYELNIVDRVGGGDSFAAGAIFGVLNGYTDQETVDFAVAASTLKHSIEGDFNRVSLKEVNQLVQGDETGRVQR